MESGFKINNTDNLTSALIIAERTIPDLVVINTLCSESVLELFVKQIRTERLKNVSLLSLIELEDYLRFSAKEHLVVKPVPPKLLLSVIRSLMNNEEVNWLPAFH